MELELKRQVSIYNSLDTYAFMQSVLNREILKLEIIFNLAKEHFWVIALSRASKTVNLELVSLGCHSSVVVKPAEVFGLPFYKRAAQLILVHNHPSGMLQPSQEDENLTNRLLHGGKMINMPVIDHVILTEHSYYSFKDSGLLTRLENDLTYVDKYELEEQFHKELTAEVKKLKEEHRLIMKQKLEKATATYLNKGLRQGKKEGIKEGLILGKEEGLLEGLQKGRLEEKLAIAKEMLLAGEPLAKIMKWTGLSQEELQQLIAQ